jgi:hypothetical protein
VATGRIGVTPTLGVRWSLAPAGGTTALSGLDDNSVSLVYSVGYEQVYRNGVLLSRGNDYTATDGTTVTLTEATITGDIIEIFAQQLVPLADAISKGQFTAKGTLLSATAASTPGVLGVGADGTVLTAASGEATGLEWATPSSGGYTLISTTALTSGTTVTLGSIPSTYKHLYLTWTGLYGSDGDSLAIRFNSDTGNNYDSFVFGASTTNTFFTALGNNDPMIDLPNALTTDSTDRAGGTLFVTNYLDTTAYGKLFNGFYYVRTATPTNRAATIIGAYNGTSAISSITFKTSGVDTFTNGELKLYGVS